MLRRCSLRSLLALVLLASLYTAWLARSDFPQKRLIHRIELQGGSVEYYPWSLWHALSPHRVRTIELASESLLTSPELLEQVQYFAELEEIVVYRDRRHKSTTPLLRLDPKHAAQLAESLRGCLPEEKAKWLAP